MKCFTWVSIQFVLSVIPNVTYLTEIDCYVMSQQEHGQVCPKMLYMVTFPKKIIYNFYFH